MFLDCSHESQCEALTALRSGNEDIPVPGVRLSQSSNPSPCHLGVEGWQFSHMLKAPAARCFVEIVLLGAWNRVEILTTQHLRAAFHCKACRVFLFGEPQKYILTGDHHPLHLHQPDHWRWIMRFRTANISQHDLSLVGWSTHMLDPWILDPPKNPGDVPMDMTFLAPWGHSVATSESSIPGHDGFDLVLPFKYILNRNK